ncbi:carnosine synthase 1-like [Ylistrum balloti]|uniref:carnosine synthase 1-like n=1 Tax=Ylistrum balloti TaxID=509963 RepID=UPI002905E494|nr:carnosine synthase 1-like [Ylistrum balloti]
MAGQEYITYPNQVREKLHGKMILVIGSSKSGARKVWDIFTKAKLKVIMVAPKASNFGADKVDTCIYYDYYTEKSDMEKHADNIIELLGDRVRNIDGCFTFTEEDTPISATVCRKLQLRGFHPDAALTVRSKYKTYEALRSKINKTKYKTEEYSPVSYRIQSEEDIKEAKKIIYPAILKPEQDAGSWGVVKVISEEDCEQQYKRIQSIFSASSFGERFGKSMVLMELLEGPSYNVDLVIYDGELMAAFITDIGLYLPNMFNDTTTCIPSNLSAKLKDQLTTAAHHSCCKVGLLNGVFNTEFKMTQSGLKIVEINGRVGCYRRCIVYETVHGVNLWEIAATIACGIKPRFPDALPRCFAVGVYLFNKFHAKQFLKQDVHQKLRSMAEAKDILMAMRTETAEVDCEKEFAKPFCHLVVLDSTSIQRARQALIQLYKDLGFTEKEYNLERFTSMWV